MPIDMARSRIKVLCYADIFNVGGTIMFVRDTLLCRTGYCFRSTLRVS